MHILNVLLFYLLFTEGKWKVEENGYGHDIVLNPFLDVMFSSFFVIVSTDVITNILNLNNA